MNNNFNLTKNRVNYIDRTDSLVTMILSNIKKYKPLSREEEHDLLVRYKENGDLSARDKIILHNQGFVYSNAKIYSRDSEEVFDYVNEGNIALCKAIDLFDVNKDVKFITFAVWYIRRAMKCYLMFKRDAVTKSNVSKIHNRVNKIVDSFVKDECRNPSEDEIIDILGKEDIIINNRDELYNLKFDSLNKKLDDDVTLEDCYDYNEKTSTHNSYEDVCTDEYNKFVVCELLDTLSPLNREIIEKIFGIGYMVPMNIVDISNEYGISECKLRRIIKNTLSKLKENYILSDF